MKRIRQVDSDIPKRNLRPRRSKITIDPTISLVFQTTVLDTPELLHHITNHLTLTDIKELACVCRKWNNYWTPYIYSDVAVSRYRRTHIYPKFHKYGEYTKDLRINHTRIINIIHILDLTPNIRKLIISSKISLSDVPDALSFVSLAPQLRVLHLHFLGLLGSWMAPVAGLLNLEELVFQQSYHGHNSTVHIDELLNVIKTCTKLRSLTINHLNLVEKVPENPPVEIHKVDDEGWANSSLNTLIFENIFLGPRVSYIDQPKCPHACIRRLYQHLPNLTTIRFKGKSNLLASDWRFIFKNRHKLHTVDVSSPMKTFWRDQQEPFYGTGFLNTLEQCSNLKVLSINDIKVSTDEGFAAVIRNNRAINILAARHSGFGDKAIKELTHLPNPNTLTELHVMACINITSYGASLILENCSSLKCLNLAGTSSGTIELFKGTKPWVCTRTLKVLCIDIQPIGYMANPSQPSYPFSYNQPPSEIIRYNDDEEEMIRNRLHSFTSLIELAIKGQALSVNIIKDLSFAPNLANITIQLFYKPEDVGRNIYQAALQYSKDLGELFFKGGATWTGAGYTGIPGIMNCSLHANNETKKPIRHIINSYYSHQNY